MKPALILTAALVSAGCSSLLMSGNSSGGGQLGSDSRSVSQMAEDDAISATIRSRFSADTALLAANLSVSSHDYNVTLRGTVSEFADRDRAVSIARNTDGVRSVNNQISVNTRQ